MKRSDSDEQHGSSLSGVHSAESLAAADFSAADAFLDETQEALAALEKESALDEDIQFEFEGQFNDAPDVDEDDVPVDETTMLVVAYLDNELSDEEREQFETRLQNDKELQERVESERRALGAIDELRKEPTTVDLTEKTVDKLNTEAKAELEKIRLRNEARARRAHALQFAAPVALFIIGYLVFAAVAPNVSRQRERDAAVVERLAQFEAVGDFEYLRALADANLFEEWREAVKESNVRINLRRAQFNSPKVVVNNEQNTDAASAGTRNKSYKELLQDPVFYRLQRRFESLDKPTQTKWRELRRQIDKAPDRDKLLQTLDDYTSWLVSSTNPTERLRLEDAPIPGRIMEIRRKLDESLRFVAPARAPQTGAPDERRSEPDLPGAPAQPGARQANNDRNNQRDRLGASLRSALPAPLQREDLRSVYNQYVKYRQDHVIEGATDGEHDDVLDFLTNIPEEEIIAGFSQESKDVLSALEPQRRSSLIGLVVSLSFLENADRIVQTRPMQWGRRNNGYNYGFQQNGGDSVQSLARTLRTAKPEIRDYITSCPALEAHGVLMSLQWGFFRDNTFGVIFDPNGPDRRNDRKNQPGPREEDNLPPPPDAPKPAEKTAQEPATN